MAKKVRGFSLAWCTTLCMFECSSWDAFVQKVCRKLGVPSIAKIVAESDGAEVEDVDELMTGDKLIVFIDSAEEPSTPAFPAAASGSTSQTDTRPDTSPHTSLGAGVQPLVLSPVQAKVHEHATKLRKRNAAADVGACLVLIQKLAANAEKAEAKFRSIRLTIPKIAATVSRHPAAIDILAELGLVAQSCAVDSDSSGPVDSKIMQELSLQHEFMVLPRGQSLTLSAAELQQVLSPHLSWAEARTSTVSGTAGYAAVKSQLAQVRKEYGKSDVSQVPAGERYKLYPVYMAAEAVFMRKQASATPVPRCPELSRDPHTRGAVTSDGDAVADEDEGATASAAGGAAAGADFSEDDIIAELGGKEELAGAQALLAAAGGATSKSMAQYVSRHCATFTSRQLSLFIFAERKRLLPN